jgi:hypothetical protein
MDANACIAHAMDFGKANGKPVRSYECKFVRCFVDGCFREAIRTGTFPSAKDHSYKNIARAVNKLASERGFGKRPYEKRKFYEFAVVDLHKLFGRLELYPENCSHAELQAAKSFFASIAKNIAPYTNPNKSPVPEDHDLVLFVSAHNLVSETVHIVSDDSHFTGYASEIDASSYSVGVIPVMSLSQIVIDWGWPVSG